MSFIVLSFDSVDLLNLNYDNDVLYFLNANIGNKLEFLDRDEYGFVSIRINEKIIKLDPILFIFKLNFTKVKKAITFNNIIVEDIIHFGKRDLKKDDCPTTEDYPIMGNIDGNIYFWTKDGRVRNNDRKYDIVSNIWYTYFMKCKDDSLYAGITTDLEKRVKQHNGLIPGGAKYTQAKRPVSLVYYEVANSSSEAAKREYVIRKLNPKVKKEMVKNFKGNTI